MDEQNTTQAPETTPAPKKTVKITVHGRMSNSAYHRCGKPCWWIRLGDGARFLRIPQIRGDQELAVTLDRAEHGLRSGDVLSIGVGPRTRDGVRSHVTIK